MVTFGAKLLSDLARVRGAGEDPLPVYQELGAKGSPAPLIPPTAVGRPYREYLDLIEELARPGVALAVGIGSTPCLRRLQRFGTRRSSVELLPPCWRGKVRRLRPHRVVVGLRCRQPAHPARGQAPLRHHGRKQFCTRGGEADLLLVMARTGVEGRGITAFVVDRQSPGSPGRPSGRWPGARPDVGAGLR